MKVENPIKLTIVNYYVDKHNKRETSREKPSTSITTKHSYANPNPYDKGFLF